MSKPATFSDYKNTAKALGIATVGGQKLADLRAAEPIGKQLLFDMVNERIGLPQGSVATKQQLDQGVKDNQGQSLVPGIANLPGLGVQPNVPAMTGLLPEFPGQGLGQFNAANLPPLPLAGAPQVAIPNPALPPAVGRGASPKQINFTDLKALAKQHGIQLLDANGAVRKMTEWREAKDRAELTRLLNEKGVSTAPGSRPASVTAIASPAGPKPITMKDLKEQAKALGIKKYSTYTQANRAELEALIAAAGGSTLPQPIAPVLTLPAVSRKQVSIQLPELSEKAKGKRPAKEEEEDEDDFEDDDSDIGDDDDEVSTSGIQTVESRQNRAVNLITKLRNVFGSDRFTFIDNPEATDSDSILSLVWREEEDGETDIFLTLRANDFGPLDFMKLASIATEAGLSYDDMAYDDNEQLINFFF